MRALLCGMRGSTPAPGLDFAEVGGNTSCIAIPAPGSRWLLLDAGTGMARLAGELDDEPLRASILLTHLHWDHTHGLPFLPNADRPDAELDVLMPAQGTGASALDTMARAMSPPHFPVAPDGLEGTWRYHSLEAGRHEVEGFEVTAAEVEHMGGRTFGYRVSDGTSSLAYLPDHAPNLATPAHRSGADDLVRGVDVLLHGAGYLEEEREIADVYGHATVDDAIAMATAGDVGRLVLIHHAPRRTDVEVRAIGARVSGTRHPFPIDIGRERSWIDTGSDEFPAPRRSHVA